MRKLAVLLVGGLLAFNVSAQKLGHVSSQEVMLKMEDYKSAESEMKRFQEEETKRLEMFAGLIQEQEAQFQKDAPNLPEEIKQSRYQELMEKGQKFQEEQMAVEQKLQEKEGLLLQNIMKKVQDAVAKVAKENGYSYIYESTSLLYAGGDDISPLVKKELGIVE